MYTTDCVNQIVCFIYDDYISVKPYSTGFSCGLVEKDVIRQNDKLVEDNIEKNLDFLIMKGWYFIQNNYLFSTSTNYFQQLTLESWHINLEQTPLNYWYLTNDLFTINKT